MLLLVDEDYGSPPPMRGKVVFSSGYGLSTRITPAYAGKSDGVCAADHSNQDHPRLCGEKLNRFYRKQIFHGSPPPMRGKEATCSVAGLLVGITPAYAGKRIRHDGVIPPF